MSINQRIRELRKALNLSQVKFAQGISISNGYVAAIELGKREVNERIIKLICAAYGVSERWLRSGVGEMFPQIDDNVKELLHYFRELRPEFQNYLIQQLNLLVKLQKSFE